MDLYRDVIELLSDNDCVIIPNFGGFVTNYIDAQVDISSQEFFPPSRLIAFNENLKSNDGLLINYLSSTRGISWTVADNYVSQFVEEINKSLNSGQTVNFDKLGKFSRQDDCLVFEPNNSALANDSYGLSSFYFPLLKNEAGIVVQKPMLISKTQSAKINREKKSYAKIIYASSIAAVLGGLAFLSLQYNLLDLDSNNLELAKIIPIQTHSHLNIEEKTIDITNQAAIAANLNTSSVAIENIPIEEEISVETTVENSVINENLPFDHVGSFEHGRSYVIAGCFSTFENAINLKKSLIEIGYASELFKMKSGLVGVCVKSYPSFQDASAELKTLKSETGNSSLWIHN